jgi:hypothetical protein
VSYPANEGSCGAKRCAGCILENQMHPPNLPPWVVLHLPHVSTVVRDEVCGPFLIDGHELATEIDILTDQCKADLFPASTFGVAEVRASVSRALVDVERSLDGEREPDWVVDPGDNRSQATTCIAPETRDAYQATHYRADAAPPVVLRIGEPSARLRELHARWGVDASVFVTAFNPESRSLDEAENARRHEALREEIDRRGLRCLEGAGQHPTNGWPPERSFLVLGVDLDEAREWGARWQQNAVVWAGADAVPRLILLR